MVSALVLSIITAIHAAAAAPVEGEWAATFNRGELNITLLLPIGFVWRQTVNPAELHDLNVEDFRRSNGRAAFSLVRPAGVFSFRGSFEDQAAHGKFTFTPDRRFVNTLRSMHIQGTDKLSDRDLYIMAWAGALPEQIRELQTYFANLTAEDVKELLVNEITPEYVRSLRATRLIGIATVSDVVELRVHDVTAQYLKDMAAVGFTNLSVADLVQLREAGVTAPYVRDLQRRTKRRYTVDELVEIRAQGNE